MFRLREADNYISNLLILKHILRANDLKFLIYNSFLQNSQFNSSTFLLICVFNRKKSPLLNERKEINETSILVRTFIIAVRRYNNFYMSFPRLESAQSFLRRR